MKNKFIKLVLLLFIIMPLSIMFNGWIYMEAYRLILCPVIENICTLQMPDIPYSAFICLLFIFMLFSSNKNTGKRYDDLNIEFFADYIGLAIKKIIILILGILITYMIF